MSIFRKPLATVFALLVLVAFRVLGDGCVVPAVGFPKVQIPDQSALIHYDKGVETLVIDTSYKGSGTNFAWIVPVPTVPTIESVSSGLFPTLRVLFRPQVIHDPEVVFGPCILLGGLGLFSIIMRRRGWSRLDCLVAATIVVMFLSCLLPALSTAGYSVPGGELKVVDRKRVGAYDTVTLASTNGKAVLTWLDQNGFVTPTNLIPTISSYAEEGWVFVASKIHQDKESVDPVRPHPLALRFKTERPVYPLRLTGIGNDLCRIELYVFGPARADIKGFNVERCTVPAYPSMKEELFGAGRAGEMRIRHPGLRKMVEGSPVATKLAATLNSASMAADAYIQWTPFQLEHKTVFSRRGATRTVGNYVVPIVTVAFLIWFWSFGKEPAVRRAITRGCAITSVVAFVSGFVVFLCLPKIEVSSARHPLAFMYSLHREFSTLLAMEAEKTNVVIDLAWARRQLEPGSSLRGMLGNDRQTNIFTGQLWREEDSPGNCLVRQNSNAYEYVWFDVNGGERVEPLSSSH